MTVSQPLTYRLLTGPDDATFCARVSQALAEGYQLHGSPALSFDGHRVIAAQAVVLPAATNAQRHRDEGGEAPLHRGGTAASTG